MDDFECTQCCWMGSADELISGDCPACGAPVTFIDDYDINDVLSDIDDLDLLFEDELVW